MRPLTSAELIQLWEQGHEMTPVQRAIALAEAASDEETGPPVADLSLGERDHRLMLLRRQLFGTQINGVASCEKCGAVLDVGLDLDLLTAGHAAATTPVTVRWHATQLCCRVLTTADLIAAAQAPDADSGADSSADFGRALLAQALLTECVAGADGGQDLVTGLPDRAVAEVMSALAAADPLADVRLAVTCGECGHQWDTAFDIASFLWTEICTAAERMLGEVHVLASAYGWSEAEVLAVGPRRRQFYLEAVGG